MKFLLSAVIASLLALASVSDALSLYNPAKSAKALSQKSVMQQTMGSMGMQTRRETIQMPSTSPMVPYMPPGADYAQFVDIESAMYRDRTMMIHRFIDESYANNIISIMLYLRNEDPTAPISMYFNVPGAQLRPALAIYDLMQQTKINCEIETCNLALCAGMGSMLCGAGTKGKRRAMPNSRFLLQRTGMDAVFRGQATDIGLEVRNVKLMNDRMEKELSNMTGQPLDKIEQNLKRDFYLSSDEAVQYGLIDEVLLASPRKRAASGQAADLGAFEGGDEQKYQSKDNTGGWGSQKKEAPPKPDRKKKVEDDEPKTQK